MGKKKDKISFDAFYENFFPARWEKLKEALEKEPIRISYQKGLLKPYYLDEASLLTAIALDVKEGDSVLDLCAAPGGKTLILAGQIGTAGTLVSNDRSSARRKRLLRVIEEHIPKSTSARICVTSHDASKWCLYEKNKYDKILLDVPCSSERHLVHSPEYLKKWSPARTKHLAAQAYSMLVSALEAVKKEGTILYSTCAISPVENDGVIEKMLKKRTGRFEILPVALPFGENTQWGWQVLPDTAGGRGPMYISKIKRIL